MINVDQLKHDYYHPTEILELISNVSKTIIGEEIYWIKNNIILIKENYCTLHLHYYLLFFKIKNEYKLNFPETQTFFENFFKEIFKINVNIYPMRHDTITSYYQ